jgi:hypothetical protein
MDERLRLIAEKLIEKTKEKKVIWSKTKGIGTKEIFNVLFHKYTLCISSTHNTGLNEGFLYSIEIHNIDDALICCFCAYPKDRNSDEYILLQDLYDNAKKAYYRTDEIFESILEYIKNTEGIIGEINQLNKQS